MTEHNNDSQPSDKKIPKGFINCIKCEYYFVTWDPRMPRGCKVFKFKGHEMPSVTVFKTTGTKCPTFKEKTKKS